MLIVGTSETHHPRDPRRTFVFHPLEMLRHNQPNTALQPENITAENLQEKSAFEKITILGSLSRANFLKLGAATVLSIAGTISAVKTAENTIDAIEYFWLAKQIKDFMDNAPSPEKLVEMSYHHDDKILFSPQQLVRMTLRGFGDSMYAKFGIRINRLQEKQPYSFLDFLSKIPDAFRKVLPEHDWIQKNEAVPGATTADGMGSMQLGNTMIEDDMIRDPNHEVIFNGFHGDDWRTMIATTQEMGARIHLLKNQKSFTLEDLRQVNALIAQHKLVAQRYGEGQIRILDYEYTLNQERNKQRAANRLEPDSYTYIVTLPHNLGKVATIPAKALNDSTPGAKVITLGDIPEGRKIAYQMCVSMYTVMADLLPQWHALHPQAELHTLPMIGLETPENMDTASGHLNIKGQWALAKRVFERWGMKIGRQITMLSTFLDVPYEAVT